MSKFSPMPHRWVWARQVRPLGLQWLVIGLCGTLGVVGALVEAVAATPLISFTVGSATAQDVYDAEATVEATRDARVASQVAGRLVDLPVRAGDHVSQGQVLARIDTSVVDQQVATAQAQLAQAQAQASLAHAELERARALRQKEYLSQAALDRALAQASTADAQVRAVKAQVNATHAQARWHVVRAPFDGWLAQVNVSVGDSAQPGQALMQVYDPAMLRLSAQVPESVAARLRRDAPVQLEVGQQRASQNGAQILPAVDPVSRTVTVRVPLMGSSWHDLTPGQAARMRFALAAPVAGGASSAQGQEAPHALWVPQSTVVKRGELRAVYVLTPEGAPRLRLVRLGRLSGEQVEVLAGLNPGERIARDPLAASAQSPTVARGARAS